MFKLTPTKVLLVALGISLIGLKYMDYRLDSVKSDLAVAEQSVQNQKKTIDEIKTDVQNMNTHVLSLKNSLNDLEVSNKELTESLKYKDQLLKNPGLSKKVVNDSFKKYAQDLQDVTR